jgi:uncharacterized protein YhjY with autotransporter beta-barrel domain
MECFIVFDLFEEGKYCARGVFMKRKKAEEWINQSINYYGDKYSKNRFIIEDYDIDDCDEQ